MRSRDLGGAHAPTAPPPGYAYEIEWKTKDILDDDLFLYFFLNILFLVMCYIFIWTGKVSFVLSSSVFLRFVFVCIDINNTRLWHFVRDSALIRHFSAVMTHVVFGGMHCRLCAPCGACAVSARNKCHPLPNKRANISSTIRLWPYYCRLFVTDQDNYDEESRTEAVASRHWWCWHCPNSISAASHTSSTFLLTNQRRQQHDVQLSLL